MKRSFQISTRHRLTCRHAFYRNAFTLIEILVVLAIIGVLAAILFPVFSSARESARMATCSSNLKQIYLGTQLYMKDSNNHYPRLPVSCGWATLVYPYVKSTEVFECPNDDYFQFDTSCQVDTSIKGKNVRNGSYDYNLLRTGYQPYISEGYVGRPTEVALFVDGNGNAIQPYGGRACSGAAGTYNNAYDCEVHSDIMPSAQGTRGHNKGFNFCFADGHVKWIGADAMDKRSLWLNTRDAEFLSSPTTPLPTPS